MGKEKLNIIPIIKLAAEAFQMELRRFDESRRENDRWPLTIREKAAFIVYHLKPDKLKEIMREMSSVKYGRHILNCVFPKFDNPDEYHSRSGVVYLDEHPVQVMGWEEQKKLVQEGVDMGLLEDWIEIGFEQQAERRGIDIEFHFHSVVSPKGNQTTPSENSSILLPGAL